VVPVYDEVATVALLAERIHEAVAALPAEALVAAHEIVFVDDGSRDGTLEALAALVAADARVRVVRFRRNFGKAAALRAGFAESRGEVVFTLDADLQDDPSEIGRLLARLDSGFDLVSGWKEKRHDPLSKTLPSRVFNGVVARFTGLELHDFNCGFKCYRREVVDQLALYGEMHRFVPALAHARGFRVGEVAVRHHPRRHGRSKYGFWRLPKGLCDFLSVLLVTRHSRTALHAFGAAGLLFAAAGLAVGAALAGAWAIAGAAPDRSGIFLSAILTLAGFHVVLLGLLADLVARKAVRGRDDGIVARVLARPGGGGAAEGGA